MNRKKKNKKVKPSRLFSGFCYWSILFGHMALFIILMFEIFWLAMIVWIFLFGTILYYGDYNDRVEARLARILNHEQKNKTKNNDT